MSAYPVLREYREAAAAPASGSILTWLRGFGPEACSEVRRIGARLLPLPAEGDAARGLWLHQETPRDDPQGHPKLHAATGRAPAGWRAPDLAVFLLDPVTPKARTGLAEALTRCGEDTLCVVLGRAGLDAVAVHAMLEPHTRARLAMFETDGPEPQSPSHLAWALLASLYLDNVICLDFEDLRTILPGTGIARWYRRGEGLERLRTDLPSIAGHAKAIGLFCGVVAREDRAREAFETLGEAVMKEVESWEAAGVPTTMTAACLIDARGFHGREAFVFCTSCTSQALNRKPL